MPAFTYLYCDECQGPRRAKRTDLPERLGSYVQCGKCSSVSLALSRKGEPFCPTCDTFQPPRIEPTSIAGCAFICCSACGLLLATAYAVDPQSAYGLRDPS